MRRDDLRRLWENPAHWRGGIYRCTEDPRVIVPKRNPALGWTINFGHPNGNGVMISVVTIPAVVFVVPFFFLKLGVLSGWIYFALVASSLVALGIVCYRLANPKDET
jgi:hypothetical protein